MSNEIPFRSMLPHHRLRAFRVAEELLDAVRDARIRDRVLRDQALKSAKSACLNTAEGGDAAAVARPRVLAKGSELYAVLGALIR